jgi:hypothetical protein
MDVSAALDDDERQLHQGSQLVNPPHDASNDLLAFWMCLVALLRSEVDLLITTYAFSSLSQSNQSGNTRNNSYL